MVNGIELGNLWCLNSARIQKNCGWSALSSSKINPPSPNTGGGGDGVLLQGPSATFGDTEVEGWLVMWRWRVLTTPKADVRGVTKETRILLSTERYVFLSELPLQLHFSIPLLFPLQSLPAVFCHPQSSRQCHCSSPLYCYFRYQLRLLRSPGIWFLSVSGLQRPVKLKPVA